jgi:hypothetical protein
MDMVSRHMHVKSVSYGTPPDTADIVNDGTRCKK